MNTTFPDLPWYAWAGLFSLLFTQSILLFLDARKRTTYYWLWGIWGILQFPMPTLMYLLFVRKIFQPSRGKRG